MTARNARSGTQICNDESRAQLLLETRGALCIHVNAGYGIPGANKPARERLANSIRRAGYDRVFHRARHRIKASIAPLQ